MDLLTLSVSPIYQMTTAILATIISCSDGSPTAKNKTCADGLPADETTVAILSRSAEGEALLRMEKNGRLVFTVWPDGSISRSGMPIDDAALKFWQAMAAVYQKSCPAIADVLKPLSFEKVKP